MFTVIKKYFILMVVLTGALSAFAQTTTFTASSGSWNVSGNWSNGVPTASSLAIIQNGSVCTVNISNAACSTLTVSGGNGETQVIISSGNSLTVSGSASIAAPTNGNRTNMISVAGTFSSTSLSLTNSSNDNRDVELQIDGGTATISGNITMNGTANRNAIRFTSGGMLKVSGSVSGGTLVAGTGTMEFNNGGSQTISSSYTYNNVTISGSGTKSLGGSISVAALNISVGTLSIGGNTLTVTGVISGSGTITGSSTSLMSVSGSGSLLMTQTSSSTRTLSSLTVNSSGTLTLANALEVTGTVTVSSGTLASAGNLTLISTASGDARIAQSAGSITGNVTVQKYVAAGTVRRWLHMASPVGGFTWNGLKDDIYITGQNGQGFDVNQTRLPSAYTYTESTAGNSSDNGWVEATSPSNSVATGKGLKIFYRGDRSNASRLNSNNPPAPNATTLDFTGTINSGTQNLNVTYTNNGNSSWDGWNFVANPYPSAIDWNSASGWTKTNISTTIYVWNAESGVYATWNGSSGTNGLSNGRIAMGQGFWVKATTTSPVLSMTEAVKTSSTATGFFKSAGVPVQSFRVSMVQNESVRDELVFNFDPAFDRSFDKTTGDALKLFNTSLNIWAKSPEGENLVINNYPSNCTNDTIVLGMTSNMDGIYTLEFSADSLPSDFSVFLIDSYRGRTIDVRKEKTWKVLINEDAASYAEGRLKLVFISQKTTALNLNATLDNNARTVGISWNSNQEINTASYEVEHSTDGEVFTKVGEVLVGDTLIIGQSNYQFTHQKPVSGSNYYRVKRSGLNGFTQFTNMAQVELAPQLNTGVQGAASASLKVYPNPAIHTLTVSLNDVSGIEGSKMEIINMKGVCVYSEIISTSGKDFDSQIQVEKLPAGVYTLLISGNQKLYRELFVKQ